MKIQITLIDPDAIDGAMRYALDHGEQIEAVMQSFRKWSLFRESVTIEIDTELGTATVLPAQ